MGDILATEADLLWMVKEVRNSDFENAQRTSCKPESAPIVKSQIKQDAQRFFNELCLIQHDILERCVKSYAASFIWMTENTGG